MTHVAKTGVKINIGQHIEMNDKIQMFTSKTEAEQFSRSWCESKGHLMFHPVDQKMVLIGKFLI